MDLYFARQPILDRDLKVFGYELLFRSSPQKATAGELSQEVGDYATSVVLEAVSTNGIETITGGTYAFVNFTRGLLLDGVATLYPNQYLVVEVLENIKVDEEVLAAVQALRENGYLIALDDYVYRPGDEPLLKMSDIIKLEVDGSDAAYENLQIVAEKIDLARCRLLAEKVETEEVFHKAAAMGCTLFQGYFFAKPKMLSQKTVSPLYMNQLRLVQEMMKNEIDYTAVSDIIKNDVGLSYKILRLVNSAYFGSRSKIANVHHAVVFLGTNELKRWTAYIALTEINDNNSSELIIMSMVRAYFCDSTAKRIGKEKDADAYFLAGLFSLLDTIVESPPEVCLKAIVVPPVTREALLGKDNPGRYLLDLIHAIENGEWENVSRLSRLLGLPETEVSSTYLDAIRQVEELNQTGV